MQYNDISRKDYGATPKRNLTMNELHQYIDVCLIDEYAEKDLYKGYSLDINHLNDHERANFLDEIIKHDSDFRDLVFHRMQELVNQRLPERETKNREASGLELTYLSNGDIQFNLIRDFYDE